MVIGRALLCATGVSVAAFLVACGSNSPSRPTPTVTQVQVGFSGTAPATLAPGASRQLFATATSSTGTVTDVTNIAMWQSSQPGLATVSPTGLLQAAAEGDIEIYATYQGVRGTLRTQIRRVLCTITLTPPTASHTAFGGSTTVNVAVASEECRWSARTDAPWFQFSHDPGRAGSGSFSYVLPPNSTPDARSAVVIVSAAEQSAEHVISQARPLGCSYVTRPESATFTAAGGSGSFEVITTPSDCQWNATTTLSAFGVTITSGWSGIGAQRVTYSVDSHSRPVDVDGFIEISGLSGLNPPGRHRITIQRR